MTLPTKFKFENKYWFSSMKPTYTKGCVIIETERTKTWWCNGKLHRTNGPAVIIDNNELEWWLNGKRYDFEEYVKLRFPRDCKEKTHFLLKWNNK